MRKTNQKEDAVSEIVGEMLMLTIVLILLALFSSSLSNYLPPPRDPSVTIKMSPLDKDTDSVLISHVGGDILKIEDLMIIKANKTDNSVNIKKAMTNAGYKNPPIQPGFFGLGDIYCVNSTTVSDVYSGDEITLATTRAVIYKGTVKNG